MYRFYGLSVSRLRECGLPLRDVAAMASYLPEESSTYRVLNPHHPHSHDLEMLRSIEHSLRWLVWAKTTAAEKGQNVPEHHWFPWEDKPVHPSAVRGDAMSQDEADEFLGWGELRAV